VFIVLSIVNFLLHKIVLAFVSFHALYTIALGFGNIFAVRGKWKAVLASQKFYIHDSLPSPHLDKGAFFAS